LLKKAKVKMIESYDDHVINKVEEVLKEYPTKDELFRINKKVVLVLEDDPRILYSYLKEKYGAKGNLLVQNVVEADNATFLFHNNFGKSNLATRIADKIYLRKIIYDFEPIEVKVLSAIPTTITFCKHCFAYYYCPAPTDRPCFAGDRAGFQKALNDNFFKLFESKLEFEIIDLRLFEWEDTKRTIHEVSAIYNRFRKKIENFTGKLCHDLAPEKWYKNNSDITSQNESYTRLQMMHQFRYDPTDVFLLPNNFEDAFQHANISIEPIKTEWMDLRKKNDRLRNWKYFGFRHALDTNLNIIDKSIRKQYSHSISSKDIQLLLHIDARIGEYQAGKLSSTFKSVFASKFKEVADALLTTIVTKHAAELSKPLDKLDIWLNENLLSPDKQNMIPIFFEHLKNEFDKYFGHMNLDIIYFWFYDHQNRVPLDWQSRLSGFDRPDNFLVTGFHNRDLEIYLRNVTQFSDFINIVDYNVRTSFEMLKIGTELIRDSTYRKFDTYYSRFENQYNISRENSSNLPQFFKVWRKILPLYESQEIVTLLENKYNETFKNNTIDHETFDFWKCVESFLFYLRDLKHLELVLKQKEKKFPISNLLTQQNIQDYLIYQSKHLFVSFTKKFIERCVQEFIRLESFKIDSVMVQIKTILIQNLKAKLDNWHISVPYRKFVGMKYTYQQFEDFFDEIKIIFGSMQVPFPEDDITYLKELESKMNQLQQLAKVNLSIEDHISTKWDWGRGFRLSQDIHSNSAASLSSPINYGFKTLMSAVYTPSVCVCSISILFS
jgi:hypothetical protein